MHEMDSKTIFLSSNEKFFSWLDNAKDIYLLRNESEAIFDHKCENQMGKMMPSMGEIYKGDFYEKISYPCGDLI